MQNAVIASTGSYVPEWKLPNSYFNELLDEDVDTWLRENLTIRERHWCREDESTADLCLKAAERALKNGGIPVRDLDLIIIATDTPEYISPSTASVVQHRLNADNAGTFDINTACAGFVTALDVGAKYIKSDTQYRNIMVIGAYAMSKFLDKTDKKTVTLFADGAGAVILRAESSDDRGFLTSLLRTEGRYHDWMGIYAGGAHLPITPAVLAQHDQYLKFVRKFPKELNPEIWQKMVRQMADTIGVKPADVDHFFFTQLNINSIHQTMDELGLPRERAHTIMDRFGYTGSACIPMALDDAVKRHKVRRGDLVFFIGSGGGLAFAGAAFRY